MRNENDGQVQVALKIIKQIDDLRTDGYIQSGNGLVTDQQFGIHDQCTGNTDSLPLTARKLVRITGRVLFDKAYCLQHFHNFLMIFCLIVEALNSQALLNDIFNCHTGIQRIDRILEDHLDFIHQLTADIFIVNPDLLDLFLLFAGYALYFFLNSAYLLFRIVSNASLFTFAKLVDGLFCAQTGPFYLFLIPSGTCADTHSAIIDRAGSNIIQAYNAAASSCLAAS